MTSLYQSHSETQHHHQPTLQQQQSHRTTTTPNTNTDGWILYYSPEGFPYYYNEITGESQWAENEQEMSEVEDHHDHDTYKYDTQNEEYGVRQPLSDVSSEAEDDDEDVEGSDSDDDDDDDSATTGTEASTSATTGTEDDGFNEDFEAYLKSPEGQQELEEERMAIEKYSSQTEPTSQARENKSASSSQERGDAHADTEMDDMVVNAFGTSAYKNEEHRYNPYQQQSYQEQFLQQKRQQQYEYEQYEYENQQRQLEQEEENASFVKMYGLPPPQVQAQAQSYHSKHTSQASVRFTEDAKQRYYEDEEDVQNQQKKYKKNNAKYSGSKKKKKKKNIADDLEGGGFRDPSDEPFRASGDNDESEDEDDSDSVVSLSSDDSDVQILREPLLPEWLSWSRLSRLVDSTIRDPVVNTSSKLYHSLVPRHAPTSEKDNRPSKKSIEYDEEGGSGSDNGSDSNDDCSTEEIEGGGDTRDGLRRAGHVLQPFQQDNKSSRKSKKSRKGNISTTSTTSTFSAIYANLSHYLSLSTLTTVFTTQQREWLLLTYNSTTVTVWNFVTNSAEFLVDGQPVRRGLDAREQSQPLPP